MRWIVGAVALCVLVVFAFTGVAQAEIAFFMALANLISAIVELPLRLILSV